MTRVPRIRRGSQLRDTVAGLSLVSFLLAACNVYDASLLQADAVQDGGANSVEIGGTAGETSAGGKTGAGETSSGGGGGLGGGASTGGDVGAAGDAGAPGDTGAGGSGTSGGGTSGGGTSGGGTSGGGTSGGGTPGGGTSGAGASTAGSNGAGAGQGGGTSDCASDCQVLKTSLLHRYSFNGTGTMVVDSVGNATGAAVNATLTGTGSLSLAGGTADSYVDLPNGMISSLSDATFEAWINWKGGSAWQRVFDFGSSLGGENTQTGGGTYVFLSASSTSALMHAAYSVSGNTNESAVESIAKLAQGRSVQLVVVFDDTGNQLSLYVDGAFNSAIATAAHLSALHDVNNWLGRSQFGDSSLGAAFDEFRIYGSALTASQISLSHASGPNPKFLP
jgi:Concanavalin A-like lectin/glucanases superfamily